MNRARMLVMWALRIYSPSVLVGRSAAAGIARGLGEPNAAHLHALHLRYGVPTLAEALRGKWDR